MRPASSAEPAGRIEHLSIPEPWRLICLLLYQEIPEAAAFAGSFLTFPHSAELPVLTGG